MTVIDLSSFRFGPKIFEIPRFEDLRGSFEVIFESNLISDQFPNFPEMAQLNLIRAKQFSLRGFHGARHSANHWKIVTCLSGSIRDAYLDLRPWSETYGNVAFIDLKPDFSKLIVVPPGFAHGFETLSSEAHVFYGTNIGYSSQEEIDVSPIDDKWNEIWENPKVLSNRDLQSLSFDALKQIKAFHSDD